MPPLSPSRPGGGGGVFFAPGRWLLAAGQTPVSLLWVGLGEEAKNGHAPRGIDIARNGVIGTAPSGSGHMANFDRGKCQVLNGPDATGQQSQTLLAMPRPS